LPALLMSTLLLAACGQKGALYLDPVATGSARSVSLSASSPVPRTQPRGVSQTGPLGPVGAPGYDPLQTLGPVGTEPTSPPVLYPAPPQIPR
jgi:predicted small lipoprotein YifL